MNSNDALLSLYTGSELEALKKYLANPDAGYNYQESYKIDQETKKAVPFEPAKSASSDTSTKTELSACLEAMNVISDIPRDCYACGNPASTHQRRTVITRQTGQQDAAEIFCLTCLPLPGPFRKETNWKIQRALDLLEQGVPQKIIAAQLGVEQSTVSKWKNSRKNIPKHLN